MDRLERAAVEAVEPLATHVAHVNGANGAQDAQVFGDVWLGEPELADERGYGALAAGEHVEDLPAAWLGDRVEGVGGGWRASHPSIIYLYGYAPAAAS